MVEVVKITQIKPNPKNPRTIRDHKFEKLKKSIQDFPDMLMKRPLVCFTDTDGKLVVLGGNMRLKAAQDLGLKQLPVILADGWTEEQKAEFLIKDNVGFGEWDWEDLANNWDTDKLDEWGLDIPDFKIEAEATDDNYEIPDEVKTDIVPGDLFEIGPHRLLCGDSTNADDVARLMNGEMAELLFTSPPYSDMREYNGGKDLSVNNISEFILAFHEYCNYQAINLGIQRKDNEIIQYWDTYIDKAKAIGYKFLSWNVWHKSSVSVGQQSAFIPIYHEWIFVFGKGFKHINRTWERESKATKTKARKVRQADGSMKLSSIGSQQANKEMESVLSTNVELGEIRSKHPATFPIELPSEYISAITNVGDVIAEPFNGSGSTMVAAHQLNRKCYGMELDPKYCQVIVDRMRKLDPTIVVKRNGSEYKNSVITANA
jgi:DNA modification methylase